ncbi:MAG: site-2 protease family protein [Clostridia bacterium]|nr:site-2 protease family protein [Clostridia bacterium]
MFSFDKRIIYVLIGIMVLWTISTYATTEGALLGLLLSIPGVLLAITFHEFAHAYAADKLGDDTPRRQGRLSLNPMDHVDPLGLAMLIFAHIGWGKPVQVNPRNYDRRMSMEKADAIVSLAGPLMNFALAIVFTLIYCAIVKFASATFIVSTVGTVIMSLISSTIIMNVGLGVFNLIPLPPLDGSKIFLPILPTKAKYWFQDNEQIFYMIFLFIWITGIAGKLISPIISNITEQIVNLGVFIFRIG